MRDNTQATYEVANEGLEDNELKGKVKAVILTTSGGPATLEVPLREKYYTLFAKDTPEQSAPSNIPQSE